MKLLGCVVRFGQEIFNVRNKRGFILLLSFIFIFTLTIMVAVLLFIVTHETRDVGFSIQDLKLLNLAEAGVQRALREIRDDYLTTTQTGIADLRGDDTSLSESVNKPEDMRYIDGTCAIIDNNNDKAILRTFDSNYTNTRIISVELHARAQRATGSGSATIEVSYTADGSTYITAITQSLTTTLTDYSADITGSLTWPIIMSSNFRLKAIRSGAGSKNIQLDSIYLKVTYGIDTNTEAWYGGFSDISLGDGKIESVSIAAEQGKVHLNTASQALLKYLMVEHGISDAISNTVATNIVNYRSTNYFDTIEEVKQVSGMTDAIYDAIKTDLTVYSFINTYSQRPAGNRSPININTASQEVLEAVFDPLSLGAADPASLAADIISARPFTCFYSSDAAVTTDFYDFVRSRSYLSTFGKPSEQDKVLDNADASSLIPVSKSDPYNCQTTEFCYDTNTFQVESLADVLGRKLRIKTIVGDDGSHIFTNYIGDTTMTGWRKENFE